ncbi:MAG: tetratricopeptide repeat protein [Anaeromyxobacter sp.]
MLNLLISLAVGAVVTAGILLGTEFGWAAAIFPGLVALVATYIVLLRRTSKQLQAVFDSVQKDIQARRIEKAIATLRTSFGLARWQFLVGSQLHSYIGFLLYTQQDLDGALPHLEKSFSRNWVSRVMLAATHYKRKDLAGARKVLEATARDNKKEGLVWATYAWLLEKEGQHDEAIAVLGRGTAASPGDEKLKAALQSLQNDKKLKLGKLYQEQWFQFMLEAPPPQFAGPGFRGGKRALYR